MELTFLELQALIQNRFTAIGQKPGGQDYRVTVVSIALHGTHGRSLTQGDDPGEPWMR